MALSLRRPHDPASGVAAERASKRPKLSHKAAASRPRSQSQSKVQHRAGRRDEMRRTRRAGDRICPLPPREIRPQHQPSQPRIKDRAVTVKTATASAAPSEASDTRLSATKDLLDQIWVRNKNQHRTQSWWRLLSMLRKAIIRVDGLEKRTQQLRSQMTAGTGAQNGIMDAKEVRRRFEEEAQIRSEVEVWSDWLRDVLVPRAYVGFTGLVGHGQFANLGVVLVGLLADVAAVVGAPTALDRHTETHGRDGGNRADSSRGDGDGVARSLAATSLRVTGLQSGAVVERTYDSDDLGEVVERTDTSRKQRPPSPRAQRHQSASLATGSDISTPEKTHTATDSRSRASDINAQQIVESSHLQDRRPRSSKQVGADARILQTSQLSSSAAEDPSPVSLPADLTTPRGGNDAGPLKTDKSTGTKATKSKSQSRTREPKRSRKNAIDDMFAGFS